MKKKTKHESINKSIERAIEESWIIDDFLPPPDKLVLKEDNTKVTILLSRRSVDFFKEYADKKGVSYQLMIKKVLDLYSSHYHTR